MKDFILIDPDDLSYYRVLSRNIGQRWFVNVTSFAKMR